MIYDYIIADMWGVSATLLDILYNICLAYRYRIIAYEVLN